MVRQTAVLLLSPLHGHLDCREGVVFALHTTAQLLPYCPTRAVGSSDPFHFDVGNTININDHRTMNMNSGYYDEEDDAPPPPSATPASPTEQTATLDQFIKHQAGGGLEVGMIEFYRDDGARRIGDVSLSGGLSHITGGLYGNGSDTLPGGVAGERTIYHPDYYPDTGSYRDEEDPESPLALATDTQQLAMNEFINAPNEDRWKVRELVVHL